MTCEELLGAMNDYVDGETQSALCQALREHLTDCAPCRLVVDNIRQTITLYRAGRQVELPAGLHERLCDVLRQQCLMQSLSRRKPR
jgi:predicted anti-sigma-YlaC factor YlaD